MNSTILYIDPGVGSYIIQGIIAAIIGIGFYFKTGWQKIKFIFRKKKKDLFQDKDNMSK